MTSPRIMTHLFADGGRIVKSIRTDYSEHLEQTDMVVIVKNMMKEQHKAMFVALRSGELDELIGFDDDEASTPPPGQVSRKASIPPQEAPSVSGVGTDNNAYAAPRPAGIFSAPPPSSGAHGSIFGEIGLDEKSLDDAILSYLAEDEGDEE